MKNWFFLVCVLVVASAFALANDDRLFDSQNTCFAKGTRINVVGGMIPVEQIKFTTELLGFSDALYKSGKVAAQNGIAMPAWPATYMPRRESGPKFINLVVEDAAGNRREIKAVSDNVPVYLIKSQHFLRVGLVKVGEEVLTVTGPAKVVTHKEVPRPQDVFNFGMQPWAVIKNELNGFFAEGVFFGIPMLTDTYVRDGEEVRQSPH